MDPLTQMEQAPRILGMRAYMVNEKPVLYGYEDEEQCYSLHDKQWTPKPSYVGAFTSRELLPLDLAEIIMHDLLSLEDFVALKSKNLIPGELDLLYQKIQILKNEVQKLKAVMQAEPVAKSSEEAEQPLGTPTSNVMNMILELIKAGVASQSVFEQMKSGASGLSQQEKDIIELISRHFGLEVKNEKQPKST